MYRYPTISLCIAATLFCLAVDASGATVLLNDTWADGTRTDQNLPDESQWFVSSSTSLTASPGNLRADWATNSSRLALTYFTDGAPASIGIGQSLVATWVVTPDNVIVSPSTTRGVRVGLFDSSNGSRYAADSFSTGGSTTPGGENYGGYVINMNFATTFTTGFPIEVFERTGGSNANLMGSSSVFTSLGSGPAGAGVSGEPAFMDGTQYTFQFIVKRTGVDSVDLTASWRGSGLNISHTESDVSGATLAFDTFAFRTDGQDASASIWDMANLKVELVPEPASVALAALALLSLAAAACRRR